MKRKGEEKRQKRTVQLHVRATEDEARAIAEKLESSGLSLNEYMIRQAIGRSVRSVKDAAAWLEVSKLRGDIGRVGGLLKQCLSKGIIDNEQAHLALSQQDKVMALIKRKLLSIKEEDDD